MNSLRDVRTAWRVAVLATCLCLGGCGTARRGTPLQPPLDVSDPEIARGQEVYMRFCNGCHPGGEGGLGPGLNNKPAPAFLIRFQVRHGLGVMPAFKSDVISDDDLDALVAYMIRLRHHG